MPKIVFDQDEYYDLRPVVVTARSPNPLVQHPNNTYNVSKEKLEEWQAAIDAYRAVQEEMGELVDRRAKKEQKAKLVAQAAKDAPLHEVLDAYKGS